MASRCDITISGVRAEGLGASVIAKDSCWLINAASSEGRRNTCAQFTCWSLEAQSFSRALIETQRDLVQLGLRVAGKVGSLRQVLTQQAVGVFVRSSLPGGVRITEVNFHIRGYREAFVFSHFQPANRFRQVLLDRCRSAPRLLLVMTICSEAFCV